MSNSNLKSLKMSGDGVDGDSTDELERQRIKRIRESDIVKDMPALEIAYKLAKAEPVQPRMYGLMKLERVLFGLPVDKQ